MFGTVRLPRWLVAAVAVVTVSVAALEVAFTPPAQAQFFGDEQYRRARPQSGSFFQGFFGPFNSRSDEDRYGPPQRQRQHTQQPSDSSRAPPPRKTEAKDQQDKPTTSVLVMGDGMSDWLAYGLEQVFSDSPEVNIVRKNKLYSGLLHYDAKGDLDWWHAARDILADEKANYVVMMLGLSDRQDIQAKDVAKEAETRAKDSRAKDEAKKKSGQKPDNASEKGDTVEPALQPSKKVDVEFRSNEWEKIYSRRIDETINALKNKGVPVFWVGLPSIRGARSTADAAYLNDFYRARAERAGIVYIDVWDGFVDENGKYSNYGPDYEGQMRRLRSSDGVFFTKYGALKLAHYVERELRRYMSNRVVTAPAAGSVEPSPSEKSPAARPLAGPVVPLTGTSEKSDDLLGALGSSSLHGDAIATKVLVKGEAVAAPGGRADNFVWPPNSADKATKPVVTVSQGVSEPEAVSATNANASASIPVKNKKRNTNVRRLTQKASKGQEGTASRSSRNNVPHPQRPIGPWSESFGSVR